MVNITCKTCKEIMRDVPKNKQYCKNCLPKRNAFRDKLKSYDLSEDSYNKLLIISKGLCMICKDKTRTKESGLVIDHSHKSLRVRGLLCRKCNSGIGGLGDDYESLLKVKVYLNK